MTPQRALLQTESSELWHDLPVYLKCMTPNGYPPGLVSRGTDDFRGRESHALMHLTGSSCSQGFVFEEALIAVRYYHRSILRDALGF
jgi:hypothetical protein